ncbi:VrrA/YqfQ family protein [Fervidibacillus halotolerans]|uniref:YqfQ family protein n=1 Tax=Fervidibacillus halotolerans TaxID=2980027 RepID=A0A9E8LY90_9BACI|nr:VrrA/YqfQ family protein [Fervidibacillus halotolerans]WAA11480.1 YqfQ family protein [Fervidibacillus halotolerans]
MQPVFQKRPNPFYPSYPPPNQYPSPFMFQRSNLPSGSVGRGGRFRNLFSFNRPNALNNPMDPFQMNRMIPTQTASTGQNIWNLDRISRFLGQTQQVLNTAQQIGPMIQQYGPLIRNLPTLWKLYKGVKSEGKDENVDEPTDQSLEENIETSNKMNRGKSMERKKNPFDERENMDEGNGYRKTKKRKKDEPKPSVPKLYI